MKETYMVRLAVHAPTSFPHLRGRQRSAWQGSVDKSVLTVAKSTGVACNHLDTKRKEAVCFIFPPSKALLLWESKIRHLPCSLYGQLLLCSKSMCSTILSQVAIKIPPINKVAIRNQVLHFFLLSLNLRKLRFTFRCSAFT